jgi:hypothetical protein
MQEVVAQVKAFNDKLLALHTGVSPELQFFQEPRDETKTMAELTETIPDHANAYVQSLAKDGITHTLATVQLFAPRVELARLKEFQVVDYSLEVLIDAKKSIEDLAGHLMGQFWPETGSSS